MEFNKARYFRFIGSVLKGLIFVRFLNDNHKIFKATILVYCYRSKSDQNRTIIGQKSVLKNPSQVNNLTKIFYVQYFGPKSDQNQSF